MKKQKTMQSLLLSLIALMMSLTMLVGSTFAWFTDSVTSAGNIIKSGTLDVTMEWAKGTEDPTTARWIDASEGAIFNYDKWEPGYAEVRHVKIENEGTLALKYQFTIVANGEVSELADVIDVYYVDPAVQVKRSDLTANNRLGTLTEVLAETNTTASGVLKAGEAHTVTIALKMQESAGNEYQNKSIGTDFSVVLQATQASYESDSIGDDYDEDAKFTTLTTNYWDLYTSVAYGEEVAVAGNIDMSEYAIAYGEDCSPVVNIEKGVVITVTPNANSYMKNTAFVSVNGANITINNKGTFDLNYTHDEKQDYCAPFYADASGTITVNGGTYLLGMCTNKYHIYSQNSGKVIINEGTFITSNPNAAIAYCINGFIEINGGYFENTANPSKALLDMGNNKAYINNQKITISGGTFVNWNPMDSTFAREWPGVPALIVLANGCEVVSETQANGDIWYTVVRK